MHGEEALVAFKVKVGSFKASRSALLKGLEEGFLPFLRSTLLPPLSELQRKSNSLSVQPAPFVQSEDFSFEK
jgi:hypothetical protein